MAGTSASEAAEQCVAVYLFCWAEEGLGGERFEQLVPLEFMVRRLRRIGSQTRPKVLFLAGLERVSSDYVLRLTSLGLDIIDVSAEYEAVARRFQVLDRFGDYEKRCFLRWLLLRSQLPLKGDERQIFHIDGDVLFNVPPEQLMQELRGKTIVIQGCPAFTSIADYSWFDSYERELALFAHDVEGYSQRAWEERDGLYESHRLRWSGTWSRQTISSDQDLISYLIHSQKLPQDDPRTLAASAYYFTENPMYLQNHAELQVGKRASLRFWCEGPSSFVEGKEIVFWHFQSDFSHYARTACALRRAHLPVRVPNHLEHPSSAFTRHLLTSRLAQKGIRRLAPSSRRQLYESLHELHPDGGRWSFAHLFNRRAYWARGTFAK